MICMLAKWWVSRRMDEGVPLPDWAERHVTACPECAAFRTMAWRLAGRLTRDAAAAPVRPVVHRATGGRRFVAAAAGLALAGAVLWGVQTRRMPEPVPEAAWSPGDEDVPTQWLALDDRAALPYDAEMTRLASDAEQALQFLANAVVSM